MHEPEQLRPAGTTPVVIAVLTCDPTAARRARHLVVEGCRVAGVAEDVASSAELLVSEVVTNAVVHGRSDVRLRVVAAERALRVEVGDDNTRRPTVLSPDERALGGRGLTIVEVLATRWGVEEDGIGKTVWFEIAA